MKIAIVSDTHDNLANIKIFLDYLEREKIKKIFHCGDVSTFDTLRELSSNFSGKIVLVLGNVDQDHLLDFKERSKELSNLEIFEEEAKIETVGKKFAFVHFLEMARKLALSQEYDLIFYGHTHRPWKEKIGKTWLINPGNLAGLFYKATFAVYDIKKDNLELKIIERLK